MSTVAPRLEDPPLATATSCRCSTTPSRDRSAITQREGQIAGNCATSVGFARRSTRVIDAAGARGELTDALKRAAAGRRARGVANVMVFAEAGAPNRRSTRRLQRSDKNLRMLFLLAFMALWPIHSCGLEANHRPTNCMFCSANHDVPHRRPWKAPGAD